MDGSAHARRSGFWTTVVAYGLALAVLVFILKYFQYRFLIRDLAVEVYIGVVAVLFTALGIWVGSRLLRGRKVVPIEPPPIIAPVPLEEVTAAQPAATTLSLGISARELEVLGSMALGHTNQEIADILFISLATVKSHTSSLFSKLDVRSRTQAVLKAKALGIIT
jgi:two-component system, NarL family, response regulator LiaR